MNGFDLSTISNCYVGSTPASAIYIGSTQIWPSTPPPHDYSQDYFTIKSISNNNTITWKVDSSSSYDQRTISVSLNDGNTWSSYASSLSGRAIGTLNSGDKMLIKGNNASYGNRSVGNHCNYFVSSGNFDIEGNIMSLMYGDNFVGQTTFPSAVDAFEGLFYGATGIVNANNLILPVTTLKGYCYWHMFDGCTSLITPPELPATTLASYCYADMFYGCTSLTTAPVLPATTLVEGCYANMFQGCTSLTTAPELPATTLANNCYNEMFFNCTSLNYIKCLATDISASNCTYAWVINVASIGTFVKDTNTTWPTGIDGIPTGWTIVND